MSEIGRHSLGFEIRSARRRRCWRFCFWRRRLFLLDKHPTTGDDHYYEPLPQDWGVRLKLMLRRFADTGRLMQVTAHPDDEDGNADAGRAVRAFDGV